jgi:signal transduction histidine kinase
VDTLGTINAGLAGFFGCAAVQFAFQWWFSRSERVFLVFSLQCLLYAAFCVAMTSYLRARTIPDAQAALDRFVSIGVLCHAVFPQIFALLSGRRDRVFRVLATGALVVLAVVNQWAPLRGTIVELRFVQLPGGGTTSVPIRTPPGASLVVLYLVVTVVLGYGFFAARVIWKRDRGGALLIGGGTTAVLAGSVLGFLVDFAHVRSPYGGALPHVIFVLFVALFVSREYAARSARLAASERRADLALRETGKALATVQAEQRRREEAEIDRQKAVEAFVQAQRKELASQLAAGVAHDFSNVLHVISLWSSIMATFCRSAADSDRAIRALAAAQKQGRALSRQMMALARPEARSVARFPLDRPVHNTLLTLKPALPASIQLRFEAPAAPEVEACEAEIQQVIYNLVLNARDAMPEGGTIQVLVGLERSSTPVQVVGGSLAPGPWATLAVKDTGPGIDAAIRARIFDVFFTTKGPQGGSGLGLAAVMRIAKVSGGGVALETEPGRGATFRIYLPCA